MIVIEKELTAYFDIDDTIVLWSPTKQQMDEHGIEIECPGGLRPDCDKEELVTTPSWKTRIVPHLVHIEQIKLHKMRGHAVILWSAGGSSWVKAVVDALQLNEYVDLVITKPTWAYDDMPPDRILPKIQWKEDK